MKKLALAVTCLVVGGVAGLAAASTVLSAPPVFTAEQPMNPVSESDWEPYVATDPLQPVVYISARNENSAQQTMVKRSANGGSTFTAVTPLPMAGGKWQADQVMKVDTSGKVYVVWLTQSGGANNWYLFFSTSTNGGTSWSTPVRPDVNDTLAWADKPWMTVSPDGTHVYIGYYGSTKAKGGTPKAFIVTSVNGGTTFAVPQRVNTNDGRYWFAESAQADNAGNAYFAFSRETTAGTAGSDLYLVRSANGGGTWTTTLVDSSTQGPACNVASPPCLTDNYNGQIVVALDPAGRLMVAYTKNAAAGARKVLYTKTSIDHGVTWTSPVSVTADRAGDQGFQQIAAGQASNDFRVLWSDDRNGASRYNTYFSRTSDGGVTWTSEVLLSNVGTYPGAAYKTATGYHFPFGDYAGLAVTSTGANVAIWGEGENRDTVGGSWYAVGN